ncbi:uncharacterized protein LOC6553255 [Drosophila erecta]|uniref:GG20256 n=1 Tax=Drosophila erecta TaxID=7220 RepID=B3P3X4_DROER|nr:uncharacterized protein LOC6553255 [Drosophila erecta]EDV49080.1 uncharacterized protein Dere_GG20256 [Drosophila erecta]
MTQEPNWKKAYDHLVREHLADQNRVHLLQRQLRHFRSKRLRLQNEIEEEGKGMDDWIKMMENLHRGVERFQKHKHLLSPKKKKQLRRIIRKLPMSTLEEQVRLMEVSEQLVSKPCKEIPAPPRTNGDQFTKYSVPQQKKGCDPQTLSPVDKRLARINANLKALQGIHEQTSSVIADIHSLMATINYLERGHCTNIKITPFVESAQGSKPSIKATIKLDRLRRTKHGTLYTRELMDVHPPYILDHVPQLKPNIFEGLRSKSKKTKAKH